MKNILLEQLKKLLHQMAQINDNIFKSADYKDFLSLCTNDITILAYIAEHILPTSNQISISKNLPKTTVVTAVSRLKNRGYLISKKNPLDGREQLLSLTPLGEEVNKQHLQYEELFLNKFMELFQEQDYQQLAHILERSKKCNTTKL